MFRHDSGDSQDDSPGGKAAHKTTQHLQAWTSMDRHELQRNCPEMRKTLGKPGFLSGEDRNRTFASFPNVFDRVRKVLKQKFPGVKQMPMDAKPDCDLTLVRTDGTIE
ncbi:MAG: hypothetical protein MUC83_15400 [Pirellula sp.]|nr:hypothetical protein [Pirellula sp.]